MYARVLCQWLNKSCKVPEVLFMFGLASTKIGSTISFPKNNTPHYCNAVEHVGHGTMVVNIAIN